MCQRANSRVAFGKPCRPGRDQERIADPAIEIEQARLLTLKAAWHDGHRGQQRRPRPRSR